MLSKRYRLRKNIEFVATYAQKKFVSNEYLSLNIGKTKPAEDFIAKAAFVVSKKIDKRAVVRNKIKRRMREAYKEIMRSNPALQKWMSMIFSAKSECVEAAYSDIKASMEFLVNKAYNKYD